MGLGSERTRTSRQHVDEDTPGAPGELVAERVVRVFRSRKSSAVADEAVDFAAARVYLVEALHGQQVVDAWVDADLIKTVKDTLSQMSEMTKTGSTPKNWRIRKINV